MTHLLFLGAIMLLEDQVSSIFINLQTITNAGERFRAFFCFMRNTMTEEPRYKEIAERLIDALDEFEEIRASEVRIAYLSCEKEKRTAQKVVFGECHKVEEKYKWVCPYDFMIILYEPNIAEFTDAQLETLIRHELHHVGVKWADTGIDYYVVPHDVEEFWSIINDCGLDWSDSNAKGGTS